MWVADLRLVASCVHMCTSRELISRYSVSHHDSWQFHTLDKGIASDTRVVDDCCQKDYQSAVE